jgi:pimeloyl-ACP methyl ester carboxylesterase
MTEEHPRELAVNELVAGNSGAPRRRLRSAIGLPDISSLLEFARLLASPIFWTRRVPLGNGHSVLVIPGYGAGDLHYIALRSWLRRLGYTALPSGMKSNPGWTERVIEDLRRRVENELRSSGRKVTLIGHSLGGLQAHSVARRWPHLVGRVVVLGAPLMFAGGPLEPAVVIASIYTSWDLPFEPAARESHAVNIHVRGSHNGLGVNARVYRLLADFLSKPDQSA